MMTQQDACTLLDEDHRRVELLFAQYQAAGTNPMLKTQLAHQICQELTVHTQIEDEIFYPAVRQATGDNDMIEEAKHEHDEARQLIAQIEGGRVEDALVAKLQQAVDHHVGEERTEMFPKARQAQGLDLMALAQQLEARKSELMAGHPA